MDLCVDETFLNAERERIIVLSRIVKISEMADFVKCDITSPSETPTIIEEATPEEIEIPLKPTIDEIMKLRSAIKDLHDRHEEDRKCILILQSQIDHMRGAKCTDSFESSFNLMFSAASYLWSKVPSISIGALLKESKKRNKKKDTRGISSASTSTTYSTKKLKNAAIKPDSKRKSN